MADIEAARKVFDRFDLNGDGLITAAEFHQVMSELGDHHVTVGLAQTLIDQHDGDGDGLLSFEEFWQARQKATSLA
ncbi:MAG TPA: EF-hand domain-containing protein [Streptomyces sp.]|uniref:EF-hand domain-containing protein n=1 Tax=Streptomyces sp. TaxID=1931 RepID=UPI002D5C8404|nr:EF-hand domain-containing protein [Streptomyces sp.]HZG03548.1 EF-hand domain-containing protein [Streptomyces sp.]